MHHLCTPVYSFTSLGPALVVALGRACRVCVDERVLPCTTAVTRVPVIPIAAIWHLCGPTITFMVRVLLPQVRTACVQAVSLSMYRSVSVPSC